MKKPHPKDQRDGRARSAMRTVKLHALLFGGTSAAADPVGAPLGTSLLTAREVNLPKLPAGAEE
jgi:hypothetical protein